MYSMFNEENRVEVVLYTDALVTRGLVRTSQHRVTDILNHSDDAFLILEEVTVEELGHRGETTKAAYAQVNLDAVLFAVSNAQVPDMPELRTPKQAAEAIISVPPFKVTGSIHLLPTGGDLRHALVELTGRFLPVTEATYWSDPLGEARQQAVMVAINHHRAQILAPHTVVDPWAGLDPAPSPGALVAEPGLGAGLEPGYDPSAPDERIR
jgi:hypothetical protein